MYKISLLGMGKISEGLKEGKEVWEISMRCADVKTSVENERRFCEKRNDYDCECIYHKEREEKLDRIATKIEEEEEVDVELENDEEEDDSCLIDIELFTYGIKELRKNRLDVKLADEEMLKDVIDTVKVCSTCDQYDSPWGCCYNAHPICDRIFNNK